MSSFELGEERNVLGEPLQPCSTDPVTGYFRTGSCEAGPDEVARHLVCCEMTAEFLAFSKSVGNDLTTPMPQYNFPGLRPGDRWCIHIARWREALEAGMAPRVAILSTHRRALDFVSIEDLKRHAFDLT
ncbi:MAG TPA: DUF2237 domain-containing protein [Alphaproteobacteria bacterium]|nr:DUF2237 domain-containing protein [Alphaproteobacteria bacterium]